MGWPMGFEPTTTGITIQDSTIELRPPLGTTLPEATIRVIAGLPGGTRTHNPQLRRLVLYPIELRAETSPIHHEAGRGGEIRTPDILLPKQARYQTAPHPEKAPNNTLWVGIDQCSSWLLAIHQRCLLPLRVSDTKAPFSKGGFRKGNACRYQQEGVHALHSKEGRGVHEPSPKDAFPKNSGAVKSRAFGGN